MLCPELVGRDEELAQLLTRLDGLADGRGGVVALLGEAGAGKSRLARAVVDAAAERGVAVLAGRAVPSESPLPYRPLTEAFLAAFRGAAPPDDPSLEGFTQHLGAVVPAWRTSSTDAAESPLLLGEAVVRLLRLRAASGTVLLLEDVHWADAETLAVVDYLADALRTEPVLCVCTSRPEGAAPDLLDRLRRRDSAAVVAVEPLADDDVEAMVAACLGEADPPAQVREFVRRHGDGSPFLVEELLAGLVASDGLRQEHGRWTTAVELTPTVPASLRTSIQRRLGALDATSRRVLGAAALMGRSFDWDLLPGIVEVDGRTVVDALRAAVEEQLVEVDGSAFRFRHALTREAVLDDVLPPERRELATRAWPAHERAHPGLPGATLELAADLAEAAGDSPAAARHLVASARRAQASGALVTAEATARRARRLAPDDHPVSLDADEGLLHVLVAAGQAAEARAVGAALATRLDRAGAAPGRRADLLVVTARGALAAGDGVAARTDLTAALEAAAVDPEPSRSARLDALAAEVAFHEVDLAEAERLARAAVDRAAATGQPEVEASALLTLGQVVRTTEGMDASLPWFQRAGEVAATAGLAQLHLRARQEQAVAGWTRGDITPIFEIRALAAQYGALVTVAVMDLSLADISLSTFDKEQCLAAATACVEASRRYGLATEPVAHLWLAGAHALHDDVPAMDAAVAAALAHDPGDPRILGDLHGRVLPTLAFVQGDLERLPGLYDTMIEHARAAPPTTSVFPGRVPWAILRTIDDDDLGAAARAELGEAAARTGLFFHLGGVELTEAIALGRQGLAEAAAARFEPSYTALVEHHLGKGMIHCCALLCARAAIRDGWGDPVRWLRASEAFFATRGYGRLARRCRSMIGEAGAPVPRRGRGDSEVPAALRALGVTSREMDVLKLVAAGRTNKGIAEALFLSPKTVERHVGSLFARLGVSNRQDLAALMGDPAP